MALSVIAAIGVGIMLSARIAYGIASHRALPDQPGQHLTAVLDAGRRHRRRQRILLVMAWVYLLTTSVQNTFSYVLNNTGILYATFYCITALSAIVYYRRRVLSNWADAITIGVLPLRDRVPRLDRDQVDVRRRRRRTTRCSGSSSSASS